VNDYLKEPKGSFFIVQLTIVVYNAYKRKKFRGVWNELSRRANFIFT
jgi:hypothetical protein